MPTYTFSKVPIAASTSGANTLVAAVANTKILVVALSLVAGAAGDVYFLSDSTVVFGGSTNKIKLAQNQHLLLPHEPEGWMVTAAGEALVLNASSTGPFSGGLVYALIPA